MKSNKFRLLISIMSVFLIFFIVLVSFKSCENRAISREKTVETQIDNISIEQQNLFNSLSLLSENVKFSVQSEKEFQEKIAELRTGKMTAVEQNISLLFNAIRENPPNWSSSELLRDMGIAIQKYNENVAKSKKAYREAVKSYEYFTQKWPNRSVLELQGYEIKTYEHLSEENVSLKIESNFIDNLY